MDDVLVKQPEEPGILNHSYETEMSGAYLDYAMSVIVSRALPDVRDGMKPVHRRIMWGMVEGGYVANQKHKKSAKIVGDVMGKYHPHGDASIYQTMVRLAQRWAMRCPLVDGQGNFGSVDRDPPAAMRYTEARMSRLAMELVSDIDDGTVSFRPNYDNSEKEPTVLPARFPNLLVNGGIGIAVGMASNIPTHNLAEAINASLFVLNNPSASLEQVLEIMPGPDFPTRGVIMGRVGIRDAYLTGRGSFVVSGVASIEDAARGRQRIIITELPYDVSKEQLVTDIHALVMQKKLDGISDCRDESGREDDLRVVIDVKADSDASVVLNNVRKMTDFQINYSVNMTCLDARGRPREMPLLDILTEFVAFRRQTVRLRTQHQLDKARATQIKQIGLYAAVTAVDDVVAIIRGSADVDEAKVRLMQKDFPVDAPFAQIIRESDPDENPGEFFRISDVQADAILALALRRLTGLEREKIADDLRTLRQEILGYLDILGNQTVLDNVLRNEMIEIREKHGDARRTVIETTEADAIDDESLVERKDVVITLTNTGYVKRTELSAYRSQRRGGKGKLGMETKDDDYVVDTVVCNTRTPLLVFSAQGQVYSIKTFRLPEANANAKGRPIVNFIELGAGDSVIKIVPLPEDRSEFEHKSLCFVTDFGSIRRNRVTDFLNINRSGKIAMKLQAGDGGTIGKLVNVLVADDSDDVMVTTANGQSVRYLASEVRLFVGRDSTGVRAISLKDRDVVVSACVLPHSDAETLERDAYLGSGITFIRDADLLVDGVRRPVAPSLTLTPAPDEEKPDRVKVTLSAERMSQMLAEEKYMLSVSEFGFGKRSSSHEYRVVSTRGGSGIAAAILNERTGNLVACVPVSEEDGLVLVTDGGQTIRTPVATIGVHGRNTRGSRLLSVPEGQRIVGVAVVPASGVADDEPDETDETVEPQA